jgi:hypothetical protein
MLKSESRKAQEKELAAILKSVDEEAVLRDQQRSIAEKRSPVLDRIEYGVDQLARDWQSLEAQITDIRCARVAHANSLRFLIAEDKIDAGQMGFKIPRTCA